MKACMTEIFTKWFLLLEKKRKHSQKFQGLQGLEYSCMKAAKFVVEDIPVIWSERLSKTQTTLYIFCYEAMSKTRLSSCGLMHEIQLILV